MNIFIISIYLSFIFHQSHGKVIQPESVTVNQDRSASISCEYANVSVEDIRLFSMSQTDKQQFPTKNEPSLCQKGRKDCKNIAMYEENPNKLLFILLNIGPEAMNMTYLCEFTVKKGDVDDEERGTPTKLLPGEKKPPCAPHPPPPPPPLPQFHQLMWILIGLLAVMFLYSCVITSIYINLRLSDGDPENSIYVEMRKAPPPRDQHFDVYCG